MKKTLIHIILLISISIILYGIFECVSQSKLSAYDYLLRYATDSEKPEKLLYYTNDDNAHIIFYIAEKKIVIELDGIQHTSPEHKEADKERDQFLASWKITVLRYSNESIRKNFRAVVEDIMKKLELDYKDLKPL